MLPTYKRKNKTKKKQTKCWKILTKTKTKKQVREKRKTKFMAYKKSNTQERRLVLKIRLKYIIKKQTQCIWMCYCPLCLFHVSSE